MPRLSKIGAAALAAFGWTSGATTVSASYLIVAGGAGGGVNWGGGGGAGGYRTSTTSLNITTSYTVVVGAGGAGGTVQLGTNGSDSSFSGVTSTGGGGGGANAGASGVAGVAGGSGGGGGSGPPSSAAAGGAGTSGQGNNGGAGFAVAGSAPAGGGGGASAVGATATASASGNGGAGSASSISGASVTYAGGGGGGGYTPNSVTAGAGGAGGGAAGAAASAATGASASANLGGGGGGGAGNSGLGGSGGSGIVIISYAGAQQFGGGVVTSVGGNTIHTFTTSGTLSTLASLSASYLIVAGGAGSASYGGGGGAGGLLSGSGTIIDTASTYLVTVGAGGAGVTTTTGNNGASSTFSMVTTTAVGGGYGSFGGNLANSGGSGGGGGNDTTYLAGGSGTVGQGNNGGNGVGTGGPGATSGGGGGAGAVGGNGNGSSLSGNGGVGLTSSISGTSTYYAGGGGGGGYAPYGVTGGTGGLGGGGNGATAAVATGTSGTANTGGGGGGGAGAAGLGGSGGSGVVIISYAGATQQMAGGSVTITGGNVIHTFTSSGYLTPLTYYTNSLRFKGNNSAYLSRTPVVVGNRKTWTWSAWVKRSSFTRALFMGYQSSDNQTAIGFSGTDSSAFFIQDVATSSHNIVWQTSALFRDPAAWYHVVVAYDTTQASSANAVKLYVNGTEQTLTFTAFSGAYAQNRDSFVNALVSQQIGTYHDAVSFIYFDGYMTNINLIDGQALTPNSFGTFNSIGVWQPINYGGSYGTNGFLLPFTNTTSATTLGYDFSPNNNNFTATNISVTAGATYDAMTDVPTLTSTTAANYATFNPLLTSWWAGPTLGTLTYANLRLNATDRSAFSTIALPLASQTYFEYYITTMGNTGAFRDLVVISAQARATYEVSYLADGTKQVNGTNSAYGSSWTSGDTIGVAFDPAINQITFYKNNVSQGAITNTVPANTTILAGYYIEATASSDITVNFGQQPWKYTPPVGYVGLNTFNM